MVSERQVGSVCYLPTSQCSARPLEWQNERMSRVESKQVMKSGDEQFLLTTDGQNEWIHSWQVWISLIYPQLERRGVHRRSLRSVSFRTFIFALNIIMGGSGAFAAFSGTITSNVISSDPFVIEWEICSSGAKGGDAASGDKPMDGSSASGAIERCCHFLLSLIATLYAIWCSIM